MNESEQLNSRWTWQDAEEQEQKISKSAQMPDLRNSATECHSL